MSAATAENYLSDHSVSSWLLTTDHKRIGILYLLSIIVYFAIAAAAAALMRIELLTPQADLVSSETYNKLFTLHGVLMVWFFLIPSIPAVLGTLSDPASGTIFGGGSATGGSTIWADDAPESDELAV